MVVGITGKYCAGKSTVARVLVEHGYIEIDVDSLGHEALARESHAVVDRFGESVRGSDGSVDRKALGKIVFSDKDQLRALEMIVHPAMVGMVRERIEGADPDAPGIVVNAAILFRMGLDELCEKVLFVTASLLRRYLRARDRDGASVFDFMRRVRSQRDVDPQFSRHNADIQRVVNDGNAARLMQQLQEHVPLP
jgi:dephospho-CoA kinase